MLLWRPAMSIDASVIDQDHQLLLSIINEFSELSPSIAGKAKLQQTLARLYHYTHIHFAREEHLQAAVRYPARQGHQRQHAGLAHRLNSISNKVAALDDRIFEALRSGAAHDELAVIEHEAVQQFLNSFIEIRRLLNNWLTDHILKSDMPLKSYVEAMRPFAENMPPLWKAEAATLTPSADAASHSWMPAGFRRAG